MENPPDRHHPHRRQPGSKDPPTLAPVARASREQQERHKAKQRIDGKPGEHEHAAVEASAPDVKTTFLPVAVGKAEEREASEHYDKVMLADSDELKHFLKAIHRTLKRNT